MQNPLLKLPKIIAHRGAPELAPENTLASLRQAKALGAQWTEFDVRLTKDHQAVIFHDDDFGRTTNGKGFLFETTAKQVATLDAGSWFGANFVHERVPTLAEYLQTAVQLHLGINVELKGTDFSSALLAKQVAAHLATYWRDDLPTPLISSLAFTNLQAMRALGPHYLLGYITDIWVDNWQSILQSLNCISLHVNYEELTPARIQAVKQNNYLLLAYTVNDKKLAEQLFAQGVDAVFSNNPRLLS
jgi:glycerophosphoryl diester phosphodiesterase